MSRMWIAVLALLSVSSAALAQSAIYSAPITRRAIARADARTMSLHPPDGYVGNANNCGMELSRPVWGPNETPLGYACFRDFELTRASRGGSRFAALSPEGTPMRRLVAALFPLLLALAPADVFSQERIVVFAPASLKTEFDGVAADYHAHGGPEVGVSYGGSRSLARQIVNGARADIFVSSDEASMDVAENSGAIREGSRADLLRNRLVVVAPKTAPIEALPLEAATFKKAIGDGRLVIGEAPRGEYAKDSPAYLGLWDAVASHLAITSDVHAALGLLARGDATLAVVYATDAAADPSVKVVATFPDNSHPPILYTFALTTTSHPTADAFFAYLASHPGLGFFTREGFAPVR